MRGGGHQKIDDKRKNNEECTISILRMRGYFHGDNKSYLALNISQYQLVETARTLRPHTEELIKI
jgi:hypothetical protein